MPMTCASCPKDVLYSMMRKEMTAEPPLLRSEVMAAEPSGSEDTVAEPPLRSFGLSSGALSRVNWHCLTELRGRMRCSEMHEAPDTTMKSC